MSYRSNLQFTGFIFIKSINGIFNAALDMSPDPKTGLTLAAKEVAKHYGLSIYMIRPDSNIAEALIKPNLTK